jgi:hypothetical protein
MSGKAIRRRPFAFTAEMPRPKDPYERPQDDVERRKREFLAAVVASNDADAPATRRGHRKADNPWNPRPGRLTADAKTDIGDWNKKDHRAGWEGISQYDYFYWEDINVALVRFRDGGPGLPATVFPTRERVDDATFWRDIPGQLRTLPPLNAPANLPLVLGVVELLHHSLRAFLNDTILASAFAQVDGDDEAANERRGKLKGDHCYPVTENLYERWTSQSYDDAGRQQVEAALGEFSLPGTKAIEFGDSNPAPPFPPWPRDPADPAATLPSAGDVPLAGPAYHLPRMGERWAAHLASGFMLLRPKVGDGLLARAREVCRDGVLTDAIFDAWKWLAFLAGLGARADADENLRGGVPLGEALRQIAEKLYRDDRYDAETREKFWGSRADDGFLAEIPRNPFVWTVRTKRPGTILPVGFPYPDFSEQGLYWWRVLFPHCVGHMLSLRDTSDFHATDLLRFCGSLSLFESPPPSERVPEYVRTMIRMAFVHFKYWYDETPSPDYDGKAGPDDEMCFWSENHQLQFSQAAYLAGHLLPDDRFGRPSATGTPDRGPFGMPTVTAPAITLGGDRTMRGRDQRDRGRRRTEWWLDNRLRFGFSEWNSPGYYNEDITPLLNLVDFAPDPAIRQKAAMAMDLLMFDLARFTCAGSFAVAAGRAYQEHKFIGWSQSTGDLIEILFGTRGDYIERRQNSAIAFSTSSYQVPEAILGIGLDRVHTDREKGAAPFIDRSRVSTLLGGDDGDAPKPNTPEGVLFWWGNGNYLTAEMREATAHEVAAHPNLDTSGPFKVLKPGGGVIARLARILLAIARVPGLSAVLDTAAGAGIQKAGFRGAALLPFPVNVISWGVGAAGTVLTLKSLGKLLATIASLAKRVFDWALAWTGLTDTDEEIPIPESDLIEFYHGLLDTYNRGSVLQRANLYTWSNGHAMLSSVQCHQPGTISAQKQPWMATLGCDASVWTTCPWPKEDVLKTIFRFDTIGNLQESAAVLFDNLLEPYRAIFGLARPGLPNFLPDGPDQWTGSFALPMVVQQEHVAVVIYDMPMEQRASVDNGTHAWFPTCLFDDVDGPSDADGDGAWMAGRKGAGFVALYSAQGMKWEDDAKKESLWASGARNVWICIVGGATSPDRAAAEFLSFCDAVKQSRPDTT